MHNIKWPLLYLIFFLILLSSSALGQEPIHDAFAIRTITAGVNVTKDNYSKVLTETTDFLKEAKGIMEKEGFRVQGTRIITQPHAHYLKGLSLEESIRVIKDMKQITAGCMFNIGPGIVADIYDSQAIEKILKSEAETFATIVIGTKQTGIHYDAIKACAEIIKRFSEIDPFRNFYFAGIANVPPEVPFFPGGYHNRSYNSFAVGTEGASLFMKVCGEIGSMKDAKRALYESYERELKHVEKAALKIERETGWRFEGIDTTPAQFGDKSIGKAVESLIGAPFGTPGTLSACSIMTDVIKGVNVKKAGYQGLFLPPMEDDVLGKRAFDYYGLDSLLSYSAVSGTGIDVVAVPGDVTVYELEKILLDVASMANKLDKPLTARIIPLLWFISNEGT
jgi:uncharacterized protein (UPF0210 family)